MSLADNATLCLSAIIAQAAAVEVGEQIYKDVILQTILDAVHRGLHSKTEVGLVLLVILQLIKTRTEAVRVNNNLCVLRACSMNTPPSSPAW